MSTYASLTGARFSGVFDSLFVRSPPDIGPFVSVLGLGGSSEISPAVLDAKRDVSDSFSRAEVVGLVAVEAAARYSKEEADELFQTESDAVASLLLKRDIADSLSTSETSALLGAKVDESVYQSAISLKRGKAGSLSIVQTAALYQTILASDAGLATKRDATDSMGLGALNAL